MRKPKGWRNEPGRHALAARGVRTRVHLPPREEARFMYASSDAYDMKKLRTMIGESVESKPEYDFGKTSEGQANFLNDLFSGLVRGVEGLDENIESGGLSYTYESNPPRIVVNVYDEEWYDSKRDSVRLWDFTVMTSALIILVMENSFRNDIMEEYERTGDKTNRWRISLVD